MSHEHRTASIVLQIIELAVMRNGSPISVAEIENHLEGEMENPPSNATVRKMVNQMVNDGWLEKEDWGNKHVYNRSNMVYELIQGNYLPKDEIDYARLEESITNAVQRELKDVKENWERKETKGISMI